MEEQENKKQITEKVTELVDKELEKVCQEGIQYENIDYLYRLIDIHKDISNEKYWKIKEEGIKMRYLDEYSRGNYGTDGYGRRRRDSRGRYMERGVDTKYRGEDMLDEMHEHYSNYMESGNYNGQESEKAFEYMLQSAEEFFMYLMEESQNPEQMQKVKRTAKRISEMRM